MFEEINKELQELQENIYRCKNIDRMLRDLREQLLEQEKKKSYFENALKKQNQDVENLNKKSLLNTLYTITGSKDERIRKEQGEALAAGLKLEDNNKQIEETQKHISKLQSERGKVSNSQERYDELYDIKYKMLKDQDSENADKITEIENQIAAYKANLKEIEEAISSGRSVIASLSKVEDSLNSAEGWGTWDMLGGDGLITNMAKHGHVDDAKEAASDVQTKLNRFATELKDVNISSSINIDISDFAKFADYFFDGIISDWFVQSKIHESQESVNRVRNEVNDVIQTLIQMHANDKKQLNMLNTQLSRFIVSA